MLTRELNLVYREEKQGVLPGPPRVSTQVDEDHGSLIIQFTVPTLSVYGRPELPLDRSVAGLWESDVVEIFLSTAARADDVARSPYLEFQISPYNQFFELRVLEPRIKAEENPNLGLVHSAEIHPEHWNARFEIPFIRHLGRRKPTQLFGNLFAILGAPGHRAFYSAYTSPQKKPDFHQPHQFKQLLLVSLSMALGLLTSPMAQAARDPSPHSEIKLIAERPNAAGFWAAVVLSADPDWHTYWMNPGDSGLPTQVQWEPTPRFQIGPLLWPFPERIEHPPLVTYGYHGEVIFPVRISPLSGFDPQQPFKMKGRASWLICKEVCLPAHGEVEWSWPNAINETLDEQASTIASALSKLPQNPQQDPRLHFEALVNDGLIEVRASLLSPNAGAARALEFFSFSSEALDHSIPLESEKNATHQRWVRHLKTGALPPREIKGTAVLYGPGDRTTAWDLSLIASNQKILPVKAPAVFGNGPSLAWMGVFAFLGGLILNLMPCVFPVLSIKVLSLLQKSKHTARSSQAHAAAYTFGILLTFWVLSLGLIALRSTGEQLGWGFQLQSPVFLALLSGLFFLLGFNLLGVFEFGTSLMGIGSKGHGDLEKTSPIFASFMTGALAVVVATPCTAPFMGTAIGFAFNRGPFEVFLIFSSLGFGLASPFLLLALRPSWLSFLPRPGAWMEKLKQFLAFPLFATLIWLLWALVQQVGANGLAVVLLGLWLLSVGVWANRTLRAPWAGRVFIALILTVFLLFSFGMSGFEPPLSFPNRESSATAQHHWRPFSPEELARLRQAKTPVFIDFTAAWCLTCQVNERVVLNRPDIIQEFKSKGVVMLKADWTRRDSTIASFLDSLGRSGVPVYALYLPGQAQPKLLSEILTPGIIQEALATLPNLPDASQ